MKYKTKVALQILLLCLLSSHVYAEKKLAQTGFQFLSIIPDARSAALAGAMTTMPCNSAALWSNPAMLTDMHAMFEMSASQNQWIADINHYAATGAYQISGGRAGVIGFSVQYVDYGEIEGTMLAVNDQAFFETGIIKPYAFSFGIGYAIRLTDRFSAGGQLKWVGQNLGPALRYYDDVAGVQEVDKNSQSVLAFDFGTQYKTGFKSLIFGMSARNFSREVRYAAEGFQLPLTFTIGISMNMLDFAPGEFREHSLKLSLDAAHPRSYPEFVRVGTEYAFQNMFFLRFGYISNRDEENFTYGLGVNKFGLGFDYAYTPFGVFENVQRFSINFSF